MINQYIEYLAGDYNKVSSSSDEVMDLMPSDCLFAGLVHIFNDILQFDIHQKSAIDILLQLYQIFLVSHKTEILDSIIVIYLWKNCTC